MKEGTNLSLILIREFKDFNDHLGQFIFQLPSFLVEFFVFILNTTFDFVRVFNQDAKLLFVSIDYSFEPEGRWRMIPVVPILELAQLLLVSYQEGRMVADLELDRFKLVLVVANNKINHAFSLSQSFADALHLPFEVVKTESIDGVHCRHCIDALGKRFG